VGFLLATGLSRDDLDNNFARLQPARSTGLARLQSVFNSSMR
jgi:hypothetical protein